MMLTAFISVCFYLYKKYTNLYDHLKIDRKLRVPRERLNFRIHLFFILVRSMALDHLTEHWAAITPSTGDSENGSNTRSFRRIKSGFNR